MSFRSVRTPDGPVLEINLSLRAADQIFDLRDPVPFREKDLDDDFARYLLVAIEEEPESKHVKLCLNTPAGTLEHFSAADIEQAIRDYFLFEAQSLTGDIKGLLSEGRWALLFGFSFLFVCQLIVNLMRHSEGVFIGSLKEGFQILGWVALWQPTNLLLYQWWPILRKRRLVSTLARMTVVTNTSAPRA